MLTAMLGLLLFSCAKEGSINMPGVSSNADSATVHGNVTVTSVSVENDRIVVRGQNLTAAQHIQIKGTSLDKVLTIESKSATELVAAVTSLPILSILPNQLFNLVISTASAQSVIPIQFVINNGTITNAKLANGAVTGDKIAEKTIPLSKLSQSGAATGQVPVWDGSNWTPGTVAGGSGGGGITSLTFNNGFSGGPLVVTSPSTINIDTGTGPNKILKLDAVGDLLMPGLIQFSTSGALGFESSTNEWRFFNSGGTFGIARKDASDVTIDIPIRIEDINPTSGGAEIILDGTVTFGGTGAGSYSMPTADGANNAVLQTDGNGNVTWVTLAPGGVSSVSGSGSISSTGGSTPVLSIGNTMTAGTYTKLIVNGEGLVTSGANIGAGDIPTGIAATKISAGNVDNTEFDYLNGLTGGIQSQLDNKEGAIGTGGATQYWRGDKTFATINSDHLTEGSTNLFFTSTRAKAAAVADAINDGTTDVAPSQNAVFDALALKADDTDLANYVEIAGDTMTGTLSLANEKELRLYENSANGSNYVALKAPAILGGDYTFNLPDGSGASGQVLSTNGAGVLSWVNQSSGADNLGNHTATQDINTAGFNLESNTGLRLDLDNDNNATTEVLTITKDNGSTEIMRVQEDGRVGIGINLPTQLLHVQSNAAIITPEAVATFAHNGSSGLSEMRVRTSGSNYRASQLSHYESGVLHGTLEMNTNNYIYFKNGAADTIRMTIDGSGLVGIGTGAPSARLDILGTGTSTATKGLLVKDSAAVTNLEVQDSGDIYTRQMQISGAVIRKTGANGAGLSFADFGNVAIYGNSAGQSYFGVASNGVGMNLRGAINTQTDLPVITLSNMDFGTQFSANSGVQYFTDISQTMNQTGTAGYTMLDMDVTETTIGTGEKRLADFKVGGNSKFVVKNDGKVLAYEYCDEAGSNCKDASSGLFDNLGNHTATQTLNLNGQWLNGDSTASEGLYINTSGNVGIATSTVPARLNITTSGIPATTGMVIKADGVQTASMLEMQTPGGTVLANFDAAGRLRVNNPGTGGEAFLSVGGGNTIGNTSLVVLPGHAAWNGQVVRGLAGQAGDLMIFQDSAGTTLSKFDASGDLHISATGDSSFAGRLGIGTATPTAAKLQVESSTDITGLYIVPMATQTVPTFIIRNLVNNGNTLEMSPGGALRINDASNGGRNIILNAGGSRIEGLNTGGLDYWSLGYGTNNHLSLKSGGNIGIGTTNPSTRLEVNGTSATNYKAGIRNTAADDGMGMALFSTNVAYSNPFTISTANDFNVGDPVHADFVGGLFDWTSVTGGVALLGNSNAVSVPAVTIAANQGVTGGSNAALLVSTATQAGGVRSAIPNASSLMAIQNNGAQKFSVLGDGKVLAYEYCDESGSNCKDASSGLYDNLGNHTATQVLNMNGQWINGDTGAGEGLYVSNAGNVGIGTGGPASLLHLYQSGVNNTGLTINQDNHTLNMKITNHVGILSHTTNMRLEIGGTAVMETNGAAAVIGNYSPSFPRGLMVSPLAATYKGMVVRGLAGQTANLLEWQDSAGSVYGLLDESGKLGLNVPNPSAKLHIDETAANTEGIIVDTTGGGSSITVRDRANTSRSVTIGHTGNGLTITGGNAGATGFNITGASSDLYLASDNSNVILKTNGTERLYVKNSGEIGIGTLNPTYELSVHDNAAAVSGINITNSTTGSGAGDGLTIQQNSGNAELVLREPASMNFYTNNSLYMTLDSSGNLGVGTSSPGAKLDVNGTMRMGGSSSWTCTATEEGVMKWNSTIKTIVVCTGTVWKKIALSNLGCANGSTPQVFADNMVGCSGAVTHANRNNLCDSGWTACSAAQYRARRGTAIPTHNYWTSDNLLWSGSGSNNCIVSLTVGSTCPNEPMRVCTTTGTDSSGNACNWTNCGYDATSPNEYFGGCSGNTNSGTLCCQ